MDSDYSPNADANAYDENDSESSYYDPPDEPTTVVAEPSATPVLEAHGHTPAPSSPLKRSADPESLPSQKPLKRKGPRFNTQYLNLLNSDIEDVELQMVPEIKTKGSWSLQSSQVGMTVWEGIEKELFFEAVARLGRNDFPGIAARVRTKSALEVRQYISLMEDFAKDEGQDNSPLNRWENVLVMEDYPAAVELSRECCDALEEVADDLAQREERYETKVEKKRWGEEYWRMDADLAKTLHKDEGFPQAHWNGFAELFRVPAWLSLSEHLFMNQPDPEKNWQYIDEEPPMIQSTTLQDFHSIAVSLTKKLVSAALLAAQMRIKTDKRKRRKGLVRREDVRRAARSVGLEHNWKRHFATTPRRLGLDVFSGQVPGDDWEEDVPHEPPMTYDEVEAELLPRKNKKRPRDTPEKSSTKSRIMDIIDYELSEVEPSEDNSDDDDSDDDSDDGEDDESASEGEQGNNDSAAETTDDDRKKKTAISRTAALETKQIREEAKEVLQYSAHDFPDTHRAREALEYRIRLERKQESYAEDEVDRRDSYREELRMWRILKRPAPEGLLVEPPKSAGKRPPKSVAGLEDLHDSGRRWRDRLEYAPEWETLSKKLQQ